MSEKSNKTGGKKKKKIPLDIYDQYRPHAGIRYDLSQVDLTFDAGVPFVHLKHTAVEYEPGQDLRTPPSGETSTVTKYAKKRNRGPVWKFLEEIEAEKRNKNITNATTEIAKRIRAREREFKKTQAGTHKILIKRIGPKWFHELSNKQMQAADDLKGAMKIDFKDGTIWRTQEELEKLGLVLWPNHTKIKYALKKYYKCPVEFLLTIFRLNRPKDPALQNEYTLNDRLLLSAVVHLTIRATFRELHLRIPSPPRDTESRYNYHSTEQFRPKKKKKPKKEISPYLAPFYYNEQKLKTGIYKDTHVQCAYMEYFDYVNDMYNVSYINPPPPPQKPINKYSRPPKIPVRNIKSKMIKIKIMTLKKPTAYKMECEELLFKEIKRTESELRKKYGFNGEEIPDDGLCHCDMKFSPSVKDYLEELKIQALICKCQRNEQDPSKPCICLKDTCTSNDELIGCTCCNCAVNKNCCYCCCNKTCDDQDCNQKTDGAPVGCEGCKECGGDVESSASTGPKQDDYWAFKTNENIFRSLGRVLNPTKQYYDPCRCGSSSGDLEFEKNPFLDVCLSDSYCLCTCGYADGKECSNYDAKFLEGLAKYNAKYGTNFEPCACCTCQTASPKKFRCRICKCTPRKKILPIPDYEDEGEEEMLAYMPPESAERMPVVQQKSRKIFESKRDFRQSASKVKSIVNVNQTQSDESESSEEDPCFCNRLYSSFIKKHHSCLDIYEEYQQKMQHELEQYLETFDENRCTCGDSVKSSSEEVIKVSPDCASDDKVESPDDEVPGEEDKTSTEEMNKQVCPNVCAPECPGNIQLVEEVPTVPEVTEPPAVDLPEAAGEGVGCICAKEKYFMCKCKEKKKKRRRKKKKKREAGLKENKSVFFSERTGGSFEELTDSEMKIMQLDEIPVDEDDQMELLKEALAALAEDGYPLAKLPDCHRLPHFKIWFWKRTNTCVTMEDRSNLNEVIRSYWGHIELCQRKVIMPKMPLTNRQLSKLTWGRVYAHKRMINKTTNDFQRLLKQAYISETQEFFTSTYHHEIPTKAFRDCFFAYFPSDENHSYVYKPWQMHEYKQMATARSCLN